MPANPGPSRSQTRLVDNRAPMRLLAAFILITLPWLNPFSPGPSSAVVPLLFAWVCAAGLLLLWASAHLKPQRPNWVSAMAARLAGGGGCERRDRLAAVFRCQCLARAVGQPYRHGRSLWQPAPAQPVCHADQHRAGGLVVVGGSGSRPAPQVHAAAAWRDQRFGRWRWPCCWAPATPPHRRAPACCSCFWWWS